MGGLGAQEVMDSSNMFATGSLLARCLHQRYKLFPRWIWERVPDPANSNSGQPYIKVRRCQLWDRHSLPGGCWGKWGEGGPPSVKPPSPQEVNLPQPPKEGPILEVEEMELEPITELPPVSAPLHSGYEKHFLPTPEELGLGPPASRF